MSELREEAGIAREALVRDKKKTKQQTTLLTKWNIVLDYGESGVGMAEFCAEFWRGNSHGHPPLYATKEKQNLGHAPGKF